MERGVAADQRDDPLNRAMMARDDKPLLGFFYCRGDLRGRWL